MRINKRLIIGILIWNIVLSAVCLICVIYIVNIRQNSNIIAEQFESFHNDITNVMMVINHNTSNAEMLRTDILNITDIVNTHTRALEQVKNLIDGQTAVINNHANEIVRIEEALNREGIMPPEVKP